MSDPKNIDQILATIDENDWRFDDITIQTALETLVKLFDETDDLEQQAEINQKIKKVFFNIDDLIGEAPEEDRVSTIQKWKQVWADLSLSRHGIDEELIDLLAESVTFNPAEDIQKAVREAVERAIKTSQRMLDGLGRYGYEGYAADALCDNFSDAPTMAAEAIDEIVSKYKDYDFLADVKVEGLSGAYIARKRLREDAGKDAKRCRVER